ncbi:hypothetical protein [Sphingobium aquiterrae]
MDLLVLFILAGAASIAAPFLFRQSPRTTRLVGYSANLSINRP